MDLSHRKEFATNYFNLLKIEIYVLVRIRGSEIFVRGFILNPTKKL